MDEEKKPRPIHGGKPRWCPRSKYKLQCRHCEFHCFNPNIVGVKLRHRTPWGSYETYEPVRGASIYACNHKGV